MATLSCQSDGIVVSVNRLLFRRNRGGWLKGNTNVDLLAVRDTALYATRVIRECARLAICTGNKSVVVFPARHGNCAKPTSQFETLRRGERHDSLCQVGLELVEYGLAPAGGHTSSNARNNSAKRVAISAGLLNSRNNEFGCYWVWAAGGRGLDLIELYQAGINGRHDCMDLRDPAKYLYTAALSEELASHCGRRDSADRLSCRCPPSAGHSSNPVFGLGSKVCMRGAEAALHFLVRARNLIGIADEHGNRRSERSTLVHPRKNLDSVRLIPLRD